MKIQVKDIKPNPFRNLDKYPVDKKKVEELKASISHTSFWDNILVRKNHDGYQLAYGHHRLIALQELDIKEVNIPVRDLSDIMMLKIMANENYDSWGKNLQSTFETVRVTRDFISNELIKYETWKDLNESIRILFDSPHSFIQTKTHGVGQTTILKFLGYPWKQWEIQEALSVMKDERVYTLLVPIFEYTTDLVEFRRSIKKKNKKREKERQDEFTENEILELAKVVAGRKEKQRNKEKKQSPKTNNTKTETDEMIDQAEQDDFDGIVNDLVLDIQKANKLASGLKNNLLEINSKLAELQIEQMENFPMILDSLDSFGNLFKSTEKMMEYFGINFSNEYKNLKQ